MGAQQEEEHIIGDSDVSDAAEVEEDDIQALARAQLQEGESILGAGVSSQEVESRGICNAPALLKKMKDIQYKVPEGAKRVPWIDTLVIDGLDDFPKGVGPKDGVKLESTLLGLATAAAKEAYRRLRVMKVPCTRPSDFYAEMLRTDSQMFKVRSRAAEEERRIKIVEDRKKSQAAKKFAKKARTKKLEARAEEKRQTLDDINHWRKQSKDKTNEDDKDLEDILDRQNAKQKGENEGVVKGKMPMKSKKREAKDKKYGFGGKKKWSKSNDAKSTNDVTTAPWFKKGKGKGKGKSKGKGKGAGGGGSASKKRKR